MDPFEIPGSAARLNGVLPLRARAQFRPVVGYRKAVVRELQLPSVSPPTSSIWMTTSEISHGRLSKAGKHVMVHRFLALIVDDSRNSRKRSVVL